MNSQVRAKTVTKSNSPNQTKKKNGEDFKFEIHFPTNLSSLNL